MRNPLRISNYLYHWPWDESEETYPPKTKDPIQIPGEPLPVPSPECRPGYSPDDDQYYLEWGRQDHEIIMRLIREHYEAKKGLEILDWGCASGRVLRHFYKECRELGWKLHGVDIQNLLIEWMRQNFPPEFQVFAGTINPHLPYRDSSLDVVYGISVFTHTKYLWDMWLAEFKRILKPGGICIQTVQCETAWEFYHKHQHLDWVRERHPASMLSKPKMDVDYLLYGDAEGAQVFFREDVLKKYWGRFMRVVGWYPPEGKHFQNWIVLKNDE